MTDPERFHLTLHLDGRPVLDGWWGDEATARKKFREAVGDYGRDGARIALTDTETGEQLASWP
ncbi:hypothetical protein AAW14_06645 [Streptomyces hygroscopicus]|uniref:hypothetical protein n=1 Tax=Streptomyces hygroscopicus TaxID=1912 RepID=UPI00223F1662|nr:hypothetical protein [Streptomyces hygroscopicus]MCW7941708.1 hypothetical protein [Streptomyces hygroscopicus]